MGVQELPDGEPMAVRFDTVGEYAKAYIDWSLERALRRFDERLAAIEQALAKGAKR